MKVVGNYNKISDELRNQIPALEGKVIFQMLNGRPNHEPDENERKKQPTLYGKTQIQTQFKIKDPHTKKIVDVVLAEDWDDEGRPTKSRCFVAGMGETHYQGVFTLQEGNIEDEELYPILWLSPEREGSPCSDSKVKPLFKLVNKAQESTNTVNKVNVLLEALKAATELTKDKNKAKDFAASQGQDYSDPLASVAYINTFAKDKPELFLQLTKVPDAVKLKAEIKYAVDKGIIVYDPATKKVALNESNITTLSEGTNVIDEIASFITTNGKGKKIIEGLRKQLESESAVA